MKLLNTFVLSLLFQVTSAERWYSLGNYIEEEGTNDLAGTAVANSQDGSIIAVAAPHYTPVDEDGEPIGLTRDGRVTIYSFDSDTDAWSKLGNTIFGKRNEQLGTSLDMLADGKTIIVGTKAYNGDKREAGSVQVYSLLDDRTGEATWTQKGQTLYGANSFDYFGASVGIADNGKIIAVGYPGHDTDNKNDAGAVQVYEYQDDSGKWEAVDNAPPMVGTNAYDRFGSSLSLSEIGSIAIGAPYANDAKGVVHMYRYNATEKVWDVEGEQIAGKNAGDKCGSSVAISEKGLHVVIGSPHWKHEDKKQSGAVIVLQYSYKTQKWEEQGNELVGGEGDEFGTSVDISDDGMEIAVGAPFGSGEPPLNKIEVGHVSVYHYMSQSGGGKRWMLRDVKIEGKKEYSHQGSSVAVSGDGDQVMGGAPQEGYASVYTLAITAPPTMAPTTESERKEKRGGHKGNKGASVKGRSGFATFILVVFSIGIIGVAGFFVVKGVIYYRNKRSTMAAFQPTPNTDLELRNIDNEDDSGGVI